MLDNNFDFETELKNCLPSSDSLLHQAMRYTVLNGGKRLRPLLVYIIGELLEIDKKSLHPIAVAIELIHSYSLIHDDLPAMDNADFRRGVLSCHKQFGEAVAILAGDALQSLAFEILAQPIHDAAPQQQLTMLSTVTQAIGAMGMVWGQSEELTVTSLNPLELDREKILLIYQRKTGLLFETAIKLVLILYSNKNNYNNNLYQFLEKYGSLIGLAYQLKDDLIDHQGLLFGLYSQQEIAQDFYSLTQQIMKLLTAFSLQNSPLSQFTIALLDFNNL